MNITKHDARALIAAYRAAHPEPDATLFSILSQSDLYSLMGTAGHRGVRVYPAQDEDGKLTLILGPNHGPDLGLPDPLTASAEPAPDLLLVQGIDWPPLTGTTPEVQATNAQQAGIDWPPLTGYPG